jgi:5'-phosphate synthase pdxT subunit
MVKGLSIGVIGIQGAISEHVTTIKNALKKTNTPGNVFVIRHKEKIKEIDALVLPGGESTIISRVLYKTGLHDTILERITEENLSIMGTCAGCVLLAKEITDTAKDVKLLKTMDMQVQRNAFGRQKESFEQNIQIKGFTRPYNAVFIRAPAITKVWGKCRVLAEIDEKIVMVRQENILALSFHPELTDDLRVHEYFLKMIKETKN